MLHCTCATSTLAAPEKAGRDLTPDCCIAAAGTIYDWYDIYDGPAPSMSATNRHASKQLFL